MIDPHYPKIILSFVYRGYTIEIDRDSFQGEPIYAAWVNSEDSYAVAVPFAWTKLAAIQQAKKWIDQRLIRLNLTPEN
ncbi:MAG: hypothetical protein D6756_05665 [Cyanobacteria bacterium J083]|nr:MAG: hypothetical protein D6756_05665 [Cyanobacteria bacterium J083]